MISRLFVFNRIVLDISRHILSHTKNCYRYVYGENYPITNNAIYTATVTPRETFVILNALSKALE